MGLGYPDPCTDMWLAPAGSASGALCELTTDCPDTDYCAANVCTPRSSAGATCTYDAQCDYDGSGDFGACIASLGSCGGGRQLAFGEEGEACGEVAVSGGVADYVQCRPGLSCEFIRVPTDGTCFAPSPSGGPCNHGGLSRYCELGNECRPDDTCAPFTYLDAEEPCMPYGGESWCDPRQSLVCSGRVCTPFGGGGLGTACGIYFARCGACLRCDVPSGTCAMR